MYKWYRDLFILISNWYPFKKEPYKYTTKQGGMVNINNRNIFIPIGSEIIFPVNRKGEYDRTKK